MLNVKARKFGALDERERVMKMPLCKKDKNLKCAGAHDFHTALIEIDTYEMNKSNKGV